MVWWLICGGIHNKKGSLFYLGTGLDDMKEEFHWNLSLQWPRRGGLKEIPQWWRTEDTQFCTPWSDVTSHLSTPPVSGISIQAVPPGLSSVSQARSEAHLATLMLCLMQKHCYDSTDFFLTISLMTWDFIYANILLEL